MAETMANPDLRRKIKVRMRPDLTINKQRHHGQTFFVVKDPVSLRYYRFREEELFLLQQFDGNRTLDDVRHEFVEHFRPQRISVVELEKFVGQLLQAGIATVDTPQIGHRLYERFKKRRWQKIKQTFLNILYLKIPLFDPERLLRKLIPWTGFIFTIPFFILMLMLMTSSVLLVTVNWEDFLSKLPKFDEFFTWRNLLYFWVTLAVVKVLHEFGHGISCKKFGGEVHEMGFLMLVLTPALYCNVTDAWMLPNKWHRVVIGAAGIYVELILSAIAVWVWWYSEPGLLNTLSLALIFICSVSTVLFNGNPLLRFDGYYILSDLIEIPNLRERSNKYLGNIASRFFFGDEVMQDPYLPKGSRWFFATYAVAAYLYRWVVVFGIFLFFYSILKPYKLAMISQMLAFAAAVLMIGVPIYQTRQLLKNRWRAMKVSKPRMFWSMLTTAALILIVLFTPFPTRIDVPFILQPRGSTPVFVQALGVLKEGNLLVKDGQVVNRGAVLAVLTNPEIEKKLQDFELEQKQNLNAEMAFRKKNEPSRAEEYRIRAEAVGRQIEVLKEEMAKLTITAPMTGMVLLPPKEHDLSRTFKPGETFCEIGDPKELEAYLVVEHTEISLVRKNQLVWIKLAGHVGKIIEARVAEKGSTEIDSVPLPLSNKAGGEVATTTDQQRRIERPLSKSFAVQVPIDNSNGELVPGIRGIARLDCDWYSLYWRISRYIRQTFNFRI